MKYLENSIIRCTFAKVIKICVEMELNKELGKWLLFHKNKKYDDNSCVHIRMRFGSYCLYFRYIPGQKKLRKQFLNKSKERRVPDDTLRFLFAE